MKRNLDKIDVELLLLLDNAIARVKQIQERCSKEDELGWKIESAKKTHENLCSLRQEIIKGTLQRPSKGEVPKGTILGLRQAIGEWSDDDELLAWAYQADLLYRDHA